MTLWQYFFKWIKFIAAYAVLIGAILLFIGLVLNYFGYGIIHQPGDLPVQSVHTLNLPDPVINGTLIPLNRSAPAVSETLNPKYLVEK